MEDNEFLMGDLTPLWSNISQENSIKIIQERWNVLKRICDALDPNKASKDVEFANWFRLYRLASGLIGFQHINNCIWTFEGCYYSLKQNSPWWIETREIDKLMECDDQLTFMKEFVKAKVKQFINQPSDYKELVLSWMTIKTVSADKGNYLINY